MNEATFVENAGHDRIFQLHGEFVAQAVEFLARPIP
jgi:hypothetical protein